MAGHSHWAKIKRAKGANDAKRGKMWSKIARKIIIAARGGGDPRDNLALRYVMDEARGVNMPRDTIEKAIAKGTGESGGENFENVLYEGYGPGGVALMVEALTNNRTRTAPEMRKIFEVNGAKMANPGGAAQQFTKRGIINIRADAVTEDRLIEVALDAGAEDVEAEAEGFTVLTAPNVFHKVKEAIAAAGIAVEGGEITNIAANTVPVAGENAQRIVKLIEALEDHDDVQNVSHNAEIEE